MSDPEACTFDRSDAPAVPLHVIELDALDGWLAAQTDAVKAWVQAAGFTGARGQSLLVPGPDGGPAMALVGYANAGQRSRRRYMLAMGAESLPAGSYAIASGLDAPALEVECLGWLMSGYRFDRYRKQPPFAPRLKPPAGVDADKLEKIAAAEILIRDLINTPAEDMGPAELEAAARALAGDFGAAIEVTEGDALLDANFPMIHAVGRASTRAPRLIDMRWGKSGPTLTLVGKGVCFDTGGLDLKPASSMLNMRKDMGGAANVLGLARMIMSLELNLQLRVLIPAVENAVAGNAMRPGDILNSRKGLTVEVNNTDAEGRLVLADALALGAEENPDLMISMATLTGAARVAVGADLAPYFTDSDAVAAALDAGGKDLADPVWRLPFHDPYELKIEPPYADLDNAPSGGQAGAITAALFLRRFAGEGTYAHFDIFAWSMSNQPGRTRGGMGQGVRAVLAALTPVLKL
ncbi:leucyl aminopeptidase family protein [Chachezhania sediminis]|uniref:leucyl aminopeptidase family protein n=1 Tax=Chachezhania sediminis TaxID=2599291 RepID=UPI00131C2F20|nr:leucyl aminopeptidase family protein [Chachezhania sediminis]